MQFVSSHEPHRLRFLKARVVNLLNVRDARDRNCRGAMASAHSWSIGRAVGFTGQFIRDYACPRDRNTVNQSHVFTRIYGDFGAREPLVMRRSSLRF